MTAQFPNIAKACEQLPPRTLLDGELVAIDENGRISFNLLQHHRSKAQALLFYTFDVLIHRGINLLVVTGGFYFRRTERLFADLI